MESKGLTNRIVASISVFAVILTGIVDDLIDEMNKSNAITTVEKRYQHSEAIISSSDCL
jgi:hypothetical protein